MMIQQNALFSPRWYNALLTTSPKAISPTVTFSSVFVFIQNKNNPKFYECSVECVLIGYELKSKAYCCYDQKTGKVYSTYHVRFVESHDSHALWSMPDDMPTQIEGVPPEILIPADTNDDDITIPNTGQVDDQPADEPTVVDTTGPAPLEPRRSTRMTIPTAKNPNRGPITTSLDRAIHDYKESAEHIKEQRAEWKRILEGLHDIITPTSTDNDWAKLQLIEDPMLGDQAHQLYTLISEMSDIDPESLQFEDNMCTWEEAQNSADSKRWEKGYQKELRSLKDM